jgi:hypothetical protein
MAESGLNSGRNISVGIGDGKANILDFRPAMRLTENLFAQDEARRRAAQKQMEDIMKEYDPKRAKLRAADVDKYVDLYNNFKTLNQVKLSGKIKDPRELAKLDNEINKIGGTMQQWVAKSAQQAEFETKLADDNLRRFDDYNEDTPAIIASMRQTPVDEVEGNSLRGLGQLPFNARDISSYLAPQFDTKAIAHWGKSKKGLPKVESLGDGKFREVFTTELELQPEQIIQDANDKFLSQRDAQREFKKVFSRDASDGTFAAVVQKFGEMYPEYKGKPVVDPATYYGIKHIVSFQPEVSYGETKFTDAKKEQNMRDRMNIAQANRKALIDYRNAVDANSRKSIVNDFLSRSYEEGTPSTFTIDGQKYSGRATAAPKEVSIKYGRKEKGTDGVERIKEPDYFIITDDKKFVVPVFTTGKKSTTGNIGIEKGKPILIENYKADIAKSWLSKSDFDDEMTAEDDAEIDADFDVIPAPTQPKAKGKKKVYKGLDKDGNPVFKYE